MCLVLCSQDQDEEEHSSLEARIAQIVARTSMKSSSSKPHHHQSSSHHRSAPAAPSQRRHNHRRSHFKTQPYSERDEQVMDDEELHSLLGV